MLVALPLLFARTASTESSASQALVKPVSRGAATRGLFAFTHVNVVALTSDRVTRDVTVLIRDGRIVDIGRGVVVPAGAQRVDGRGRYLMPGLSDMHTHTCSRTSRCPLPPAAQIWV